MPGAYVYGKSGKQMSIVDGRARKSYKHRKPFEEWEVLLREHHEGYIDWAEFERNCKLLAANAYGKTGDVKWGRLVEQALLAGLLGCARCGRRLSVAVVAWTNAADRSTDATVLTDTTEVHEVWWPSHQRCNRKRTNACRGANGDRGGPAGRANAYGHHERAAADHRTRAAAGSV